MFRLDGAQRLPFCHRFRRSCRRCRSKRNGRLRHGWGRSLNDRLRRTYGLPLCFFTVNHSSMAGTSGFTVGLGLSALPATRPIAKTTVPHGDADSAQSLCWNCAGSACAGGVMAPSWAGLRVCECTGAHELCATCGVSGDAVLPIELREHSVRTAASCVEGNMPHRRRLGLARHDTRLRLGSAAIASPI